MPIEDGWDDIPVVLANAMFFAVQNSLDVCRGLTISGVSNISASFAKTFDKEAVYIANPYGFPDELSSVVWNGTHGELFVGLLISKSEHAFKLANGAERLEDVFEKADVDPYAICRRPAV